MSRPLHAAVLILGQYASVVIYNTATICWSLCLIMTCRKSEILPGEGGSSITRILIITLYRAQRWGAAVLTVWTMNQTWLSETHIQRVFFLHCYSSTYTMEEVLLYNILAVTIICQEIAHFSCYFSSHNMNFVKLKRKESQRRQGSVRAKWVVCESLQSHLSHVGRSNE